jgi:hypothetical protein
MEEVNSYIQIKEDEHGNWCQTVIDGRATIPSTANRFTGTLVFRHGMVYNDYHMPDCRWYTEAVA